MILECIYDDKYDPHQFEKWWNQINGGTNYFLVKTPIPNDFGFFSIFEN